MLAPAFARSRSWTGPSAALALVPFALLMTAAVLAAASAALGTVSAQRVGVREVATGALALICLTPVLGAGFVRLRYGATGKRTFYQQIAGNWVSSIMLVAVLARIRRRCRWHDPPPDPHVGATAATASYRPTRQAPVIRCSAGLRRYVIHVCASVQYSRATATRAS